MHGWACELEKEEFNESVRKKNSSSLALRYWIDRKMASHDNVMDYQRDETNVVGVSKISSKQQSNKIWGKRSLEKAPGSERGGRCIEFGWWRLTTALVRSLQSTAAAAKWCGSLMPAFSLVLCTRNPPACFFFSRCMAPTTLQEHAITTTTTTTTTTKWRTSRQAPVGGRRQQATNKQSERKAECVCCDWFDDVPREDWCSSQCTNNVCALCMCVDLKETIKNLFFSVYVSIINHYYWQPFPNSPIIIREWLANNSVVVVVVFDLADLLKGTRKQRVWGKGCLNDMLCWWV